MSWLKKLFGGSADVFDAESKAANQDQIKIAIDPDDYHARYVGLAEDGRQFFLTHPFEPSMGEIEGREYLALYTFDHDGSLIEAEIDDLGPRSVATSEVLESLKRERLAGLGRWRANRIEVCPFSAEHDGALFGLIYRLPEDDDDLPAVEAQPGNYMAFFEPWDSGEYDT